MRTDDGMIAYLTLGLDAASLLKRTRGHEIEGESAALV